MLPAILVRAGSLIAIAAVYAAVRLSTVETALVVRYFGDPSEESVRRTIAMFRFWNHVYVIPVAVIASFLASAIARQIAGDRFTFVAKALLPGPIFFGAFSWLVQPLPAFYAVVFVLLGIGAAAFDAFARRATHRSHPVGRWLTAAYLCVPFLAEVATPGFACRRVYGWRVPGSSLLTVLVLGQAASYVVAVDAINRGWLPDVIMGSRVERLVAGDYHGLEIDKGRRRLLATNIGLNRLDVYALDEYPARLYALSIPTSELENIRINPERDELYHFDRASNRLRAYDAGDYSLKRESTVALQGDGTAQVEFDNESKTILVTREGNANWLFAMDTFALMREHRANGLGNADVLFSSVLKKYVLSYYELQAVLRTLAPGDGRYEEFAALPYQNDVQESRPRRELFLSMPVESAVYVYDLADLHAPTRALATVFGVRGMAYDRTHDLLVTASMVNGYVEVLEPATGRVLQRVFVGYFLREIQLDEERRTAFISSRIGGVYRLRY